MAVFVKSRDNSSPPGLGKVISVNGSRATVEYFHSPTDPPLVFSAETNSLERKDIAQQTRAYWRDPQTGVWRVGRIIDGEGQRVAVRFPNGDERFLNAADLNVRWDKPISDPTPYLAQLICETPLLADARSSFVAAITAQRGASLGMAGLISSAIELEAHQIEVAKRVLQDPVQRYLLADEVGLGKTIEAGILIRQYSIDDPAGYRVVVIVPPAIVPQWCDELRRRFFLPANEPGSRIRIVGFTDVHLALAQIKTAGMLVVDEAHHLSTDLQLYQMVHEASQAVPRLLLLSATPVLRNEKGFLEMLHLLDPVVYSPDKVEEFRKKIEYRQSIAEAVSALVPENLLQLDIFLDQLEPMFPDDTELTARIGRLRGILETYPAEDDDELLAALGAVRGHLSEIYRLDRRILRNRRATVSGLTPNRDGTISVPYRSGALALYAQALEDWRIEAATGVSGGDDRDIARILSGWFTGLLSVSLLRDYEAIERVLSQVPPGSPPIDRLLAAAVHISDDDAPAQALLELLLDRMPDTRGVIFCSSPIIAQRLATRLSETLGERTAYAGGPDRETVLLRFMDGNCQYLVCDKGDEEGLNLQGGEKSVVHFDLPLAPNRIEQRIGRLDRYGSGEAIRSYVLRSQDFPYEDAWASCLADGLKVFERSIASLQYLVDAEMRGLAPRLLPEGCSAIDGLRDRLGGDHGEVAKEFRRIAQQDALDALAMPGEDELAPLFAIDQDWKRFRQVVDAWLVRCLQMDSLPGPQMGPLPPGDQVSRFGLSRDGRKPTLIPLDRFVETMIPALDKAALGATYKRPQTFPYTSRRQTALSKRGRANGVRLLRYGDVLLNGLDSITSLEDRGRCFAMWRYHSGYNATEIADPFVRFDFIVEADIDAAASLYVEAIPSSARTANSALRRRADMLFPPFFERVWLDRNLHLVSDPDTIARLEAPYEKTPGGTYVDTNLNPARIDRLRSLMSPVLDGWSQFVGTARTTAEQAIASRDELNRKARAAVARAQSVDQAGFSSLKMRIARHEGTGAAADKSRLKLEEAAAEALYQGILKPRLVPDSIGAVFLSGISYADYIANPAIAETA